MAKKMNKECLSFYNAIVDHAMADSYHNYIEGMSDGTRLFLNDYVKPITLNFVPECSLCSPIHVRAGSSSTIVQISPKHRLEYTKNGVALTFEYDWYRQVLANIIDVRGETKAKLRRFFYEASLAAL